MKSLFTSLITFVVALTLYSTPRFSPHITALIQQLPLVNYLTTQQPLESPASTSNSTFFSLHFTPRAFFAPSKPANMTIPRAIRQVFLAIEQSEGAGARVRRSIGTPKLRNFSPFLMLDHFTVSPGAGFPDHPHCWKVPECLFHLIVYACSKHLFLDACFRFSFIIRSPLYG